MHLFHRGRAFLFSMATLASGTPPLLLLHPDHPTGVYALNEKVTWTVEVRGDRTGLSHLTYSVKKDGADEVGHGTLDLTTAPATITAKRSEPGALLVEIDAAQAPHGKPLGTGGALYVPNAIHPAAPEPADFDSFWQAKVREVEAIPLHPVVEKTDVGKVNVPDASKLDYEKVRLDNIRGTHVYGQLARPVVAGKYPAILMFQFAGVYALDKQPVLRQAQAGWLALNISAHDLPIDESADYYKKIENGALKNYISIGSDDREKSYFLRMILGCVQAERYLETRADWDGRTLVVTGSSQGGYQALAAAALCPRVTDVLAVVPAGCDVYAPRATPPRAAGSPYWLVSHWQPAGRDMNKVARTAGYFDGAYFASRIRCATLMAVALGDDAARPAGVVAASNAVKGPKQLIIMPLSDHFGSGGTRADYNKAYDAWTAAIQRKEPLPIPPADTRFSTEN